MTVVEKNQQENSRSETSVVQEPTTQSNDVLFQQTIDFLQNQISSKDILINRMEKEITDLHAEIQDLKIELAANDVRGAIQISKQEKKPIPGLHIKATIGNKEYQLLKPLFSIEGKTYKAEEVVFEPEILDQILSIPGQKILRELF